MTAEDNKKSVWESKYKKHLLDILSRYDTVAILGDSLFYPICEDESAEYDVRGWDEYFYENMSEPDLKKELENMHMIISLADKTA